MHRRIQNSCNKQEGKENNYRTHVYMDDWNTVITVFVSRWRNKNGTQKVTILKTKCLKKCTDCDGFHDTNMHIWQMSAAMTTNNGQTNKKTPQKTRKFNTEPVRNSCGSEPWHKTQPQYNLARTTQTYLAAHNQARNHVRCQTKWNAEFRHNFQLRNTCEGHKPSIVSKVHWKLEQSNNKPTLRKVTSACQRKERNLANAFQCMGTKIWFEEN